MAASSAAGEPMKSVHFEVFGKVQGVFFRKHTVEMAVKHKLVGWVKNTSKGTVVGVVEGAESQVDIMKKWLSEKGSPQSKIERYEFSKECQITRTNYNKFVIKR